MIVLSGVPADAYVDTRTSQCLVLSQSGFGDKWIPGPACRSEEVLEMDMSDGDHWGVGDQLRAYSLGR